MSSIWKSWTAVKKICADKKVIFFGRSDDWVPKTAPKLEFLKERYIVDSNPAYQGSSFCNMQVFLPEKLREEKEDNIYIIITAGPYESVAEQLTNMGFTPGLNFCCTPEIRDWGLLQEIREYNKDIIVASSDYKEKGKKRHSKLGGGIYTCNTNENSLHKHISGHFRQIVPVEDALYAIEFVEKKIYVLSKKLKQLDILEIDQSKDKNEKPNACGIAYHPGKKLIFVANAGSDTINVYTLENFKLIEQIHFSDKFKLTGEGQHHINDICISKDTLYVSYFSFSGNWKKGIMDGGISELNISDLAQKPQQIVSDLWMPHSIDFINGHICYLDSMRGEFYVGNKKISGKFPGFVRGLTYDGRFYYIGQSEDMYMSRLFGLSNNIMCNAGVYLFDVDTKVSRFYSFPFMMNVHDLLVLPD